MTLVATVPAIVAPAQTPALYTISPNEAGSQRTTYGKTDPTPFETRFSVPGHHVSRQRPKTADCEVQP